MAAPPLLRLWAKAFVAVGCVSRMVASQPPSAAKAPKEGKRLKGKMTMLWPIHFSSFPLSAAEGSTLEPPEFGLELAKIGLSKFRQYLADVLPQELEADPLFSADFYNSDHSRVNHAFQRWQRRVFADQYGIELGDLNTWGPWGESTPRLPGVNYTWPELYDDPKFGKLKRRIADLARLYLQRTGHKNLPSTFRVFVWVEVYRSGDAKSPKARTDGAYVTGSYFAATKRNTLKVGFEDPRGINPPYGKTYNHPAYPGNIVFFPSWVSMLITPNMRNQTTVCYSFAVYPPEGKLLKWSEDLTVSMKVSKAFNYTRKKN